MNTNGLCGWALAALVVGGVALAAHGEYTMHGRVSYDGGATLVRGAEESDWSLATVNTLVLPGDMVWADEGGMLELELPRGAFLRMADETKVELVGLETGAVMRGWVGSYYAQRLSRASGTFRFVTPACEVEVEADSAVRIDVVGEGATTVTVRWGRAVVHADSADVTVLTSGQRVWVDPGFMPSFPVSFDRNEDDGFDQWNQERAERLATGGTSTQVPTPVSDDIIGLADLENYGEWVVVDSQPVWRPTVVVDYVPYRSGRWSYTPNIGHVWVDHYPFAYTTSHYGRWNYTTPYGWVWAYDPVWSPAWAATVRVGDYFVWSPIGYGYQPVYNSSWSYFSFGGLRFGHHASSYVLASDLYMDYGYVRYADPLLFTQGFVSISNPSIWSIHQGPHPERYRRIPYADGLRYTNYAPSRSIRGLTVLPGTSRHAQDRARLLEGRSSRSDFARMTSSGARGQRTASADRERSAQVRTLRVSRETPSYARATRSQPENAPRVQQEARRMRDRTGADPGNDARTVTRRSSGEDSRSTARTMRERPGSASSPRPERVPDATTPRVERDVRRSTPGTDRERGTVQRSATENRRAVETPRTESRTQGRPESRTSAPASSVRSEVRSERRDAPDSRTRTASPEQTTNRRQVVGTTDTSNRSGSAPRTVTREKTRSNSAEVMTRREVSRTGAESSSTARTPSQRSVRRGISPTTSRSSAPTTYRREASPSSRSESRSEVSPPASRTTPRREIAAPPSVRSTPKYSPPSRSSAPSASRSNRPASPPAVTRSAPSSQPRERSSMPSVNRSSRPSGPPASVSSRPSVSRPSTPSTTRSPSRSGRPSNGRGGPR